MAGGLRYETGREMPPGMQELYGVKLAEAMLIANARGFAIEKEEAKREAALRTADEILRGMRDKYPVVVRLECARILTIDGLCTDGLCISEACDNWFQCVLKADEVLQLSEYLKEVALLMKEIPLLVEEVPK